MVKWAKIAAAVLAAIAIILLAYAIFAEEPRTDETTTPGMGDRHIYTSTNVILIIASSFLIAIAVMFILLREEYEPLPPSLRTAPPPPPDSDDGGDGGEDGTAGAASESALRASAAAGAAEDKRESYLVLRLLTGDERRMFKAIMDSGGKALQKDLIKSTKMSNAKVSRVLDRLQEKGVITKERHGSTNMIKISVQRE